MAAAGATTPTPGPAPVEATNAAGAAAPTPSPPLKLFVSDVSGVKEEVSVEASCSHTAFLEMVSEKFGRCVPRKRPVFASIVRDGKLVRDACLRVGDVGDRNTLQGLGT